MAHIYPYPQAISTTMRNHWVARNTFNTTTGGEKNDVDVFRDHLYQNHTRYIAPACIAYTMILVYAILHCSPKPLLVSITWTQSR